MLGLKINRGSFFLILLILVNGCQTVSRGTHTNFIIDSIPSAATVVLSNGLEGKTPAIFNVPRNRSFKVTVSMLDFEDYEFVVAPTIRESEGSQLANLLTVPALSVVDVISSSKYKLSPNPCLVTLTKNSGKSKLLIPEQSKK
jgi:hypothetical protein